MNYRPTIPLSSKQILIVERDVEMRSTLARVLNIEGYLVHEAQDAAAALKAMEWVTPDLILADISPSDEASVEFYRAIHQNPSWVTIPFIFLSYKEQLEAMRGSSELGGDDYVTKPFDAQHVVRVVHARLLRSAELQLAHVSQAYLETVTMLAKVVEGRDPLTHGHIERVVKYARQLADALGWPEERMPPLELGARLHDLGKIVVRDEVLKKRGPLTPEEWQEMRQHPEAGAKMVGEISHLRQAVPYILYHHERWDGSGYPHELKGRDIPIEGRIMAIVDVYDALTTPRPYHPARSSNEVQEYLRLRSGKLFDPELVATFLSTLHSS